MTLFTLSPQPAATRRSNKFTTPARSEIAIPNSNTEPVANLVTPSDPSNDVAVIRTAITNSPLGNEQGDSKQVRFGPGDDTESPRQQNRGLVSRRGGRYPSPGNRPLLTTTQSEDSSNSVNKDEPATGYEFHSPPLKRRDEVPCLSNEQRQEKSGSPSDSSSSIPASTAEASTEPDNENKVLHSPKVDETTTVRIHAVDTISGRAFSQTLFSLLPLHLSVRRRIVSKIYPHLKIEKSLVRADLYLYLRQHRPNVMSRRLIALPPLTRKQSRKSSHRESAAFRHRQISR